MDRIKFAYTETGREVQLHLAPFHQQWPGAVQKEKSKEIDDVLSLRGSWGSLP